MAEAFQREHVRRELGAPPVRAIERFGPRLFRPLVGGAVGAAIVVLFLSLRGGPPIEAVNELTGTQRGGWNRLEDVHLLNRRQRRSGRRDRGQLRSRVDSQLARHRIRRAHRRGVDRRAANERCRRHRRRHPVGAEHRQRRRDPRHRRPRHRPRQTPQRLLTPAPLDPVVRRLASPDQADDDHVVSAQLEDDSPASPGEGAPHAALVGQFANPMLSRDRDGAAGALLSRFGGCVD